MPGQPMLAQLSLVVSDMTATLAFYRRLGLTITAAPDGQHASGELPNGLTIEFDTTSFVPQWDAGWRGQTGGGAIIGFQLENSAEVDQLFAELTDAGYRVHQPPYDAFWGARYAIVDDPDCHPVGLMSPINEHKRFWPP